jgi:hypothetical protein
MTNGFVFEINAARAQRARLHGKRRSLNLTGANRVNGGLERSQNAGIDVMKGFLYICGSEVGRS